MKNLTAESSYREGPGGCRMGEGMLALLVLNSKCTVEQKQKNVLVRKSKNVGTLTHETALLINFVPSGGLRPTEL
jgi:hypothetical protein